MSNFKGPSATGHPPPGEDIATAAGSNRQHPEKLSERYVSRRELRAHFPVSDMTIWRWMRDPEVAFPRSRKLGRNGRNFWWLPEILEWERQRTTNSPIKMVRGVERQARTTRGGSAKAATHTATRQVPAQPCDRRPAHPQPEPDETATPQTADGDANAEPSPLATPLLNAAETKETTDVP